MTTITQACYCMLSGWDRVVQMINYCLENDEHDDERFYLQVLVVDSVCTYIYTCTVSLVQGVDKTGKT